MSVALTQLQGLALDLVVDDYRSVGDIEAEVRQLMGNGVSRGQITAALADLRELNFVDAFVHRASDGAYERYRRPKLKPGVELWWRATKHGQAENSLGP